MPIKEYREQIRQLKHFDFSLKLFESNYRELMAVMNLIDDERIGLELFSQVNAWKLYDFLTHVSFKLHNYVCSAKSLIDHSRVLYSRVYGNNENNFQDYIEEVKDKFENNQLTKFIEFLRTYCQHEMLPKISSTMSFDMQSGKPPLFKLSLNSKTLLESSSIKSLAKGYISSQGEKIDLKDTVQQYHRQIILFHSWVKDRQAQIHSEEIKLLNSQHQLYRKNTLSDFIANFNDMERTTHNLKDYFYLLLSDDDFRQLDQYSQNENQWLNKAIERLEVYIIIPEEIKGKLRNKCK